jgi:hypothetical protein
MRLFIFIFLIFISSAALATKIEEMPLTDMLQGASDVALVTVEKFVGRTKDGRSITRGILRTGPGLGNTFVVTLKVAEVWKGTSLRRDMLTVVELWPGWHMEANLSEPVDRKTKLVVFLKESEQGLIPVFPPSPYVGGDEAVREVRKLLRVDK